MKDDLCGITEYPVAVIVKHPSFHLPPGLNNVKNNKEDDEDEKEVEEKIPNDGKISSEVGKNIPLDPSGRQQEFEWSLRFSFHDSYLLGHPCVKFTA